MKKKGLFSVVQLVGFVLLLALLVSCPGSPDIKIHTVTLDLGYDGAPPPEKVEIEDGKVLSPITDPVRSGYQFEAWYTADGTPYNFDTPVTESFTLTARWTPNSGGGSSAPSEEEALKGQWTVYMEKEGVETPMGNIIDIQHTLQDYWIVVNTFVEPVIGIPFKSDRTGPDKDGVFVISLDDLIDAEAEMSYSFVDNERNTLKAEAKNGDVTVMTFILERIPSEKEIKMHIVSFKLDDSISSDGYVLTSDGYVIESLAIEAGKAFGEKGLPSLIGPDETAVPAKYTMEDGKEFTKETIVNEAITVIVAPDVGE